MPFDDLDLEFEDEEESKKKKKEAIDVDVDLDFAAPEGARPRPVPQTPPPGPGAPAAARPPCAPSPVRKIEDARAAQARAGAPPGSAGPRTAGSSALRAEPGDFDSQQVVELREQMRKLELDSQVKVAVAEFKTEYLTELLSDMKLVEHQVNQLLIRINAKHPDIKNEVLMIKKILADFTAKKRK
jgi:hypothetical protein